MKVPEEAQALMRRRKLELRLNGAAANRSFASISIQILFATWSHTVAIQIQ